MNQFIPVLQILGRISPKIAGRFLRAWRKRLTHLCRLATHTRKLASHSILPFTLCWGTLVSCGRQPENTGNPGPLTSLPEVRHDSAIANSGDLAQRLQPLEPTRFPNASPADWIELTPQEIENELTGNSSHDQYLPPDGQDTVRVQKYLDEIYDRLASSMPERFVSKYAHFRIPRPIIRIRDSQIVNASVVRLRVCRGGTILLPGATGTTSYSDRQNLIASIDYRGRVALFERNQVACIDRLSDSLDATELAHALDDDVAKAKCSWTVTPKGLMMDPGCIRQEQNLSFRASGLLLTTATNLFIITTGALTQFAKEQDLRFTLAHELAHYLYAHGSLIKTGYNYFYRQNRKNLISTRPEPDPSLTNDGEKAAKLPTFRTQPIEGQKIHSEMFPYFRDAMKRIVEPLCAGLTTKCYAACAGLTRIIDRSHDLKEFGDFPQSTLTHQALLLYWEYEKEFPICTRSIPILNEESQPSLGAVSKEDASRIFWNADTHNKANLYELAAEMNKRFFEKESNQNNILAKALGNRIGYFTTEEEADNLALEWAQTFGITATQTFTYWVNYAYSLRGKEQDADLSFGYDRCAYFFHAHANQIYEDQGPLVPVGSYSDPHHSLCYRAFRTAQRLEARYNIRLDPSIIRDAFLQLQENPTRLSESPY